MDNVITFQMRSAEQEEDLGELWERMQANLTAVSSFWARDGAVLGATNLPLPGQVLPQSLGLARALLAAAQDQKGKQGADGLSGEGGSACGAAKLQPASVSPGERHVTSVAGRSRVPHMAAAGRSWPCSWGRSYLVLSSPQQGEGS